jgi:hypothetical protein
LRTPRRVDFRGASTRRKTHLAWPAKPPSPSGLCSARESATTAPVV